MLTCEIFYIVILFNSNNSPKSRNYLQFKAKVQRGLHTIRKQQEEFKCKWLSSAQRINLNKQINKNTTLREFNLRKSLWSLERIYSFCYNILASMLLHCSGEENIHFCLTAFVNS